jgi:hypothetical protein
MTKVLLNRLSMEDFERERRMAGMPRDARAITSSRDTNGRQWRIQIDKSLPKREYQRLLRHEEGHVFSEKAHINRRLSPGQKRMLVKSYGTSLAKGQSSQAKLQETVAELYRLHKYHPKSPITRGFKHQDPKISKVISNEIKRFKVRRYY